MQRTILKYDDFNIQKIIYDEFEESENKQFATSNIWYQESELTQPRTCYLQTPYMKVHEIKNGELVLALDNEKLYEELDKQSLSYVKSKNVTKQYGLKGAKYKAIVNEVEIGSSKKFSALKLKVNNDLRTKHTQFYVFGDKTSKTYDEVKYLLTSGTNVKAILEVNGLSVDIKNNVIFTNISLKQVLIAKMYPLRVELQEYSFVDSDNEETTEEKPLQEEKPTEPVVENSESESNDDSEEDDADDTSSHQNETSSDTESNASEDVEAYIKAVETMKNQKPKKSS